jgi:hypothetical protein
MWMLFDTVRGPVIVLVVYDPPHYRKTPTQQTVLDAVRSFVTSWPPATSVIVIGD